MRNRNVLKLIAGACLIAVLAGALGGCNIKEEEVAETLRAAIANTRQAGYETAFTLDKSELVLYREKQRAKYREEADSGSNQYDFSSDEAVNYEMGVNRVNWNDGDSTEWVETPYQYEISYSDGVYSTKLSILHPQQKNADTGEVEAEAYTQELSESVQTVEEGSINYLEQLFQRYASVEEMRAFHVQGVKRLNKDIIRVETETIYLSNGDTAVYEETLANYVLPGTQTTLKTTDSYVWDDAQGNAQIDSVVIGRMDFAIKKGKIVSIDMYYETIRNLEMDQRNYMKSGRIYTAKKATVAKKEQCLITF